MNTQSTTNNLAIDSSTVTDLPLVTVHKGVRKGPLFQCLCGYVGTEIIPPYIAKDLYECRACKRIEHRRYGNR